MAGLPSALYWRSNPASTSATDFAGPSNRSTSGTIGSSGPMAVVAFHSFCDLIIGKLHQLKNDAIIHQGRPHVGMLMACLDPELV